jgi:tetratricopeptide (TPR) repeat protein
MDGDTLVLACTEEDWDYAIDLAKGLSDAGKNIFLAEYALSALTGQKLFHYLDDIAERGASHEIMLLLPHHYGTNQANSVRPSNDQYVFHVCLDDVDIPVSPPWILCIRKPATRRIRPEPVRVSSKRPFDQAKSPDSFNTSPHPPPGNIRRLPEKNDKPADKPNKQSRTRRFTTVLRGLEEAIQFDDANPAAYSGLGNALWCLERYDEAYQAYLKVIQYDPGNASAYNGLGSTSWCLERYDIALQCYEEAARLSQPGKRMYGDGFTNQDDRST